MEKIKTAIVDDHLLLREGLKVIFETVLNLDVVIEAQNGKELIEKLCSSDTLPQICVLEVNMPVMDGYQTCAYLTRHYPSIKTIALSAYNEVYNIIGMIASGARAFLSKTTDLFEIGTAIREVYRNGFYHSDFVPEKLHHAIHKGEVTPSKFSERELTFLKLCCQDLTYAQIADQMCVSIRTVDNYRESLFRKLHTQSKVGLVIYAYKAGIVRLLE